MHAPRTLTLAGMAIECAEMRYIAASPETEITPDRMDCFVEKQCGIEGGELTLPAAAVAVAEIRLGEPTER